MASCHDQLLWSVILSLASVALCKGETIGIVHTSSENGTEDSGSGESPEGEPEHDDDSDGLDRNMLLLVATAACAAVFLVSVMVLVFTWPKKVPDPPMSPTGAAVVKASMPMIAMRVATEDDSSE